MKLSELAKKLEGELKGDGNLQIQGVRDLELIRVTNPEAEPQRGFLYFVESKKNFNAHPESKNCDALLTTSALAGNFTNAIVVPEPQARLAFIRLLELFEKIPAPVVAEKGGAYIAPGAHVDASAIVMHGAVILSGASVGAHSVIHPNAVIEQDVKIGAHTVIHPNVVVKHGCTIGDHCIIHSATVIGADGFGFFDKDGVRYKIPQIGNVIVGNHVEMGASVTVDRATIEATTIGDYTKFDDQVHVGHNCQVGKYVYIAGNTVLAGSVVVEDNVTLGGQTAISGKVLLRKGSLVMGMSAMAADAEPGTMYFGIPARPAREMHKINGSLVYVPELLKRVTAIEEKLGITKTSP
ncbi:MAG: UDP-3-O-(3-hydroxymyristoyl)glucosamine N-acyltransferase [Spirochaetes bacterium]|nr:UDP-3-O-(3-hydroxymyristoyl)glucosamine N-acyltransferase [Spirochaetota bacterium]